MVQIMKHEWHQVDSQFLAEVDEDLLREIYPDYTEDEISQVMRELLAGEYDLDQLDRDACDANVDLQWDRDYDDWWTDRKGGYEITYEYTCAPVILTEPIDEYPPMDP